MTQGEEPRRAPLGAGPPSDQTSQPFPNGSGGPSRPAPRPDGPGARLERLAVVALVLAVVSLLVPVLPGIAALVLAAVAARRARALPAGAGGGRGLVAAACAVSIIGVVAWVGLGALVITQRQEPAGWHAATAPAARADRFSQVTAPPTSQPPPTQPVEEPTADQTQPATLTLGDSARIAHADTGSGVITLKNLKITTRPYDRFGSKPEDGYFLIFTVSLETDDYFDVLEDDFYVQTGKGKHIDEGNGNSWDAVDLDDLLGGEVLDAGEDKTGLLVFDSPVKHGILVYSPILGAGPIVSWKF